jgi:hypothetical protein
MVLVFNARLWVLSIQEILRSCSQQRIERGKGEVERMAPTVMCVSKEGTLEDSALTAF